MSFYPAEGGLQPSTQRKTSSLFTQMYFFSRIFPQKHPPHTQGRLCSCSSVPHWVTRPPTKLHKMFNRVRRARVEVFLPELLHHGHSCTMFPVPVPLPSSLVIPLRFS